MGNWIGHALAGPRWSTQSLRLCAALSFVCLQFIHCRHTLSVRRTLSVSDCHCQKFEFLKFEVCSVLFCFLWLKSSKESERAIYYLATLHFARFFLFLKSFEFHFDYRYLIFSLFSDSNQFQSFFFSNSPFQSMFVFAVCAVTCFCLCRISYLNSLCVRACSCAVTVTIHSLCQCTSCFCFVFSSFYTLKTWKPQNPKLQNSQFVLLSFSVFVCSVRPSQSRRCPRISFDLFSCFGFSSVLLSQFHDEAAVVRCVLSVRSAQCAVPYSVCFALCVAFILNLN